MLSLCIYYWGGGGGGGIFTSLITLSLLLHKSIRRSKRPHAYLEVNIVFPNLKFNQTLYIMVTNASQSVVGTEGSLIVQ